jgi:repressor LexA
MEPLSPRQRKVYERLRDHARLHGATPDLADLARDLTITYVTLRQHLDALERKGLLAFESRGRGRSPRITLTPSATGVPLLGSIPAGPVAIADVEREGYLSLRGLDDRHFALRVHGDSMADLIVDGDVVLLAADAPIRDGAICAVRIHDDEVTLKYVVRPTPDSVQLRAHNPRYPDRTLAARDVAIDGVMRGLLRGAVLDTLLLDPQTV